MLLPAPMYQYPSALPCTASTVSRFSPMTGDFARFAIMLCRPNSQKDVSTAQRTLRAPPSTLHRESRGFRVDIEGAGGYLPHPPRRLQSAAECEEMRCGDLRRLWARQEG